MKLRSLLAALRWIGSPANGLSVSRAQIKILRSHPIPQVITETTPGPQTLQAADHILRDEVYLTPQFAPYKCDTESLWTADPYKSFTWQLYVHALRHVSHLLDAYKLAPNDSYLRKARWYIDHWDAHNGRPATAPSPWAWKDHGDAMRTNTLVYYWKVWRDSPLFSYQSARKLIRLIARHAEHLADDLNYKPNNHGLSQDMALLQVAAVFPLLPGASRWKEKAIQRLSRRVQQDVAADGMHKEHSAFYHLYVMRKFLAVRSFAQAYGISIPGLDETLAKMHLYLPYVFRPDGTAAQIGDTSSAFRLSSKIASGTINPYLLWLETKGKQGTAPPQPEAVFPEGGVASFRTDWLAPDAVFLLFTAAFHSRVHKHADDLSFVLSRGKTNFFIDSGSFGYTPGPPRDYVVSIFAHNTIAVDHKSYAITKGQAGKARIDSYSIGDAYSYVVGSHTLYPGVRIERSIVFWKPDVVIIHDRCSSDKQHTYTQIFNIGEGVTITHQSPRGLELQGPDARLSLIQIEAVEDSKVYCGQEEPLRGWYSPRPDQLVPIPSVHYTKQGKCAEFQTVIYLGEGACPSLTVDSQPEGCQYTLTFADGRVATVKVPSGTAKA